MRAFVSPHRVLKVRLESDPETEHRIEVGRLLPCSTCGHRVNVHIGGKRKCFTAGCPCVEYTGEKRNFDEADLVGAVANLVALLHAHGVTVAEVEPPHSYLDGHEIARAVVLAIEDIGITIEAPWRKELESFKAPPDSGVAAIALPQGANTNGAAPVPASAPPAPRAHGVSTSSPVSPSPTDNLNPGKDWIRSVGRSHRVSQTDYSQNIGARVAGHRVAGIDPGTARIAVVIAAADVANAAEREAGIGPPRPEYVAHKVFHIGHVEKARGLKGRSKHVFTDADVDAACADVSAFLGAHGVTRAFLESSNGGLFRAGSAEAMRSNHVGGAIYGILLGNGVEMMRLCEATWYAAIVKGKRRKRFAADPALSAALASGYGGTWPKVTNEDVRDAGGIILGALAPKKRAKPKPKATPPKRTGRVRAEKRAAKRKASGCTCKGRSNHRVDCPARR